MFDYNVFAVLTPKKPEAINTFDLLYNTKRFREGVSSVAKEPTIDSREPTPSPAEGTTTENKDAFKKKPLTVAITDFSLSKVKDDDTLLKTFYRNLKYLVLEAFLGSSDSDGYGLERSLCREERASKLRRNNSATGWPYLAFRLKLPTKRLRDIINEKVEEFLLLYDETLSFACSPIGDSKKLSRKGGGDNLDNRYYKGLDLEDKKYRFYKHLELLAASRQMLGLTRLCLKTP
ncbi:hypothetical protein G7Y89_g3425 [Cudoniella acicularis]|uniref:Uncharacterized protein n=1 Tax=Cudoniella acicularis TaxID=354080 RepID=A0A8H4RRE4_9HELO|nr:hypothetical protein G7Y89_g3425 [Cudoniella acicularis]